MIWALVLIVFGGGGGTGVTYIDDVLFVARRIKYIARVFPVFMEDIHTIVELFKLGYTEAEINEAILKGRDEWQ